MYIYEGHMGSLYTDDSILDDENLYCEQCGDSDWLIGYAATRAEAWDLLKDKTDTFDETLCEGCPHSKDSDYCYDECENYQHSGGWAYEYVKEFIETNWDEDDYLEDGYPCDTCEAKDKCSDANSGWEPRFCCTLCHCHHENEPDCEKCNSLDIGG